MYKEIKFTIKSIDGTSIPAIYAQDTARNPSKHIILLHGISTDKNEYLNFYRILSEKLSNTNIATLRIDFRGHGDSPSSPSDFSISSQLLDLAEAIKWLEHNKKVKKISLVASSFGAPPCLFALDIFNSKIDEITLIAPVLDYFKTFINPTTKWGRSLFKNIIPKSIIRKEHSC